MNRLKPDYTPPTAKLHPQRELIDESQCGSELGSDLEPWGSIPFMFT